VSEDDVALSSGFFDDREMEMLHNSSRREIALAVSLVRRIVGAEVERTPIREAGT
jgi:hypothetical protein